LWEEKKSPRPRDMRENLKSKTIHGQARQVLEPLPLFLVILIAWALLTYTGAVDSVFLPTPTRVLASFLSLATGDFLINHLLPSLFRVSFAFLLSVAIAFPLGMLSGQDPRVEKLIEALFGFTR
jgi:NitT/TauT family transport system permease protein